MANFERLSGEGTIVDEYDPTLATLRRTVMLSAILGDWCARETYSIAPDWEGLAESFPDSATPSGDMDLLYNEMMGAHPIGEDEVEGLNSVVLRGGIDFFESQEVLELLREAGAARFKGVSFDSRVGSSETAHARWQEVVVKRAPGDDPWDEASMRELMELYTNIQHALPPHRDEDDDSWIYGEHEKGFGPDDFWYGLGEEDIDDTP